MTTLVSGFRPDNSNTLVWTADRFATPAECAGLIARAAELGFADAPITTARGFVMRPDIRNNTRVMFDDEALAADLFGRVRSLVPETIRGMNVVGLNERFRIYRYTAGQRFAPHYDGAFERNALERSILTFMIYLDEDFTGGQTAFLDEGSTIVPETGRALFFQHRLLHEGCSVSSGVKHVLRSDVMYRYP